MEELKKSYFAIIPANIRYDKRLKPLTRLLYGEITALCNEKGYCWAANKYFADLYEVSIQTISSCINQLKEFGYINIEIIYKKNTKEILNRFIKIYEYPIKENLNTYSKKIEYPIKENLNTPIQKNFKDNNTVFNNTFNNKEEINKEEKKKFTPPTLTELKEFLISINSSVIAENFIDYYTSNGWMVGKNKMKDWKATARRWTREEVNHSNTTIPIKEKPKDYDFVYNDLKNMGFKFG